MADRILFSAFLRRWFDACTNPITSRHGRFVTARGENDGCSGRGGNGGVKTGTPTEPRDVAGSAFSVIGGNAEGGRSSPLPPRASEPFPVPRRSVRCSRNRAQTSIRRHLGAIHLVSGLVFASAILADDEMASTAVDLTVSVESVEEGADATMVTVTGTLNGASIPGATFVRLDTGMSEDTAIQEWDYETSGLLELTIHPYEASGTLEFTLTPVDDESAEGDEVLTLFGVESTGNLDVRSATVTIVDNDTAEVTKVRVTPGDAQLLVEWRAVDNATGYMVQWKSGIEDYNTGNRQYTVTSGSTTRYTIPNLTNGTEYTVRVIAIRTGANNGLPSREIAGRSAVRAVAGISLCAARLDAAEPVWRQAELDICWEVGNTFGTGSNTVIEWQRHFFWGENVANPWTPWKELARGDTYTPCRNSAACVQHTQKDLFRGLPFTYRMRIRTGGVTVFESPELEAQAPNSDATGLVPGISGGFLPGTVEFVEVPTGVFWFDLVFNDTDPVAKILMVEAVQGLDAADLVVTNATATVEMFDDVYKVTLTPVTLGQPVTAHLPANTVKGVGEGITASGGNNYTRDNVASNTMTWQTAPPANPQMRGSSGEPLTAVFENVPSNHDGSSAFTLRMAFSEDVEITPEAMRDHALTVTGGAVTEAHRVDERSDLWEFTVEPSSSGAVSILVSAGRACAEIGALCTSDGRMLSTGLGRSVPGPVPLPPLTASFVSVPAEHDGSGKFWLELTFDAPVAQGSRKHIRALLGATGGAVKRLRRKDGRRDHWKIRVEPSSHDAVTVSLAPSPACGETGAVCTPDGRTFTTAIATLIQGPPGLTVADAEVDEAANAVLAFAVTLSRTPSGTVTVDYATADGTATAGSDYTARSGTLTFAAGETGKTVSVPVLDDAHDEGSETLTLTLSSPSGAYIEDGVATGTINNSDLMPKAWLGRFGRTVADQVLDAVEGRMTASPVAGTQLSVAGRRISGAGASDALEKHESGAWREALTDWLRGEEEDATEGQVKDRDFLIGSSFALTRGTAEGGFGALWGRGAVSRFDGREGDLTLDGEVGSALFGADWRRDGATAGLALAHSRGEGGYRSPAGDGGVESTLTGVYPWGRYAVSERLAVWGVAGYGAGTLTLTPKDETPIETDMGLAMAAVGGRSVVVKPPAEGGLELAAKSDALVVRTASEEVRASGGRSLAASDARVTRLRLGVEGTWRGLGAGAGEFVPSLEVGVRHDGGDAETGFGADIGAGVAWTDPSRGLEAGLAVRSLLTHEAGGFRERGFAGSLSWDPAPSSQRGPSLTLSRTVGAQASGGMDALFGVEGARVPGAANDDGDELRRRTLEAKLGYGVAVFGGRYTGTPELGLGLSQARREVALGWRLLEARSAGLVFGLDVEGARSESVHGDEEPRHRLGLGLGWRLAGAPREDLELRLETSRLDGASDDREPEYRIGFELKARW